jgi:hypothetical protein
MLGSMSWWMDDWGPMVGRRTATVCRLEVSGVAWPIHPRTPPKKGRYIIPLVWRCRKDVKSSILETNRMRLSGEWMREVWGLENRPPL